MKKRIIKFVIWFLVSILINIINKAIFMALIKQCNIEYVDTFINISGGIMSCLIANKIIYSNKTTEIPYKGKVK